MPKPTQQPPTPRPPAKPISPSRISPSRLAAFQILETIQANRGNSDTLLHGPITASLSSLDHSLATTLVMGVLRWQIALDATIVPLLARPTDPLPSPIATTLRLGAFQLLHLDRIPAHAAISESVELCRLAGHDHATGMVNAILRKLISKPLPFTPTSPLLQLALETAHPVWLVSRWLKFYGEVRTRAICQAGQHQPPLTLRRTDALSAATHTAAVDEVEVSTVDVEVATVEVEVSTVDIEVDLDSVSIPKGWQPGAILTTSIRRDLDTHDEAPTPPGEFPTGEFMDEGSQLVAEIAALNWNEISLVAEDAGAPSFRAVRERVGELPIKEETSERHFDASKPTHSPARILDTCAAPGGKTLILAQRNPQSSILATDSSPSRLQSLRQRLQSHSNIRCLKADATDLPRDATNFDIILCDAPCSGTGTLARNPEIRHRLQPADLHRHADRQRNLLRAALSRLAPGGHLIYSTCSLEPEENEEVISAVLATEKNTEKNSSSAREAAYVRAGEAAYVPVDIRPSLDALLSQGILQPAAHKLLTETAIHNGQLRTLPGTHPTDGFFIAILKRTQ